jgi:hypothetical protein
VGSGQVKQHEPPVRRTPIICSSVICAGAKTARFDAQARRDAVQLEGQFGGMDVSEAKRLRELEVENAMLKKLLAEHCPGWRGIARASIKKMAVRASTW